MRDWQGKQSGIRDFNSSVTSSLAYVKVTKLEGGPKNKQLREGVRRAKARY